MPLVYYTGQPKINPPRILSREYKYAPVDVYAVFIGKGKKTVVNPQKSIDAAWEYLKKNCAIYAGCNNYFRSLSRGKTLAEVMDDKFTVFTLVPKEGFGLQDVPYANSVGDQFGLGELHMATATTDALAATILHELAHYAGATTNTRGREALAAEHSLFECGLGRFYRPEAKG